MNARQKLSDWIREKHHGQKIKKTKNPYFHHLLMVAELADQFTRLGFEIGLTHDLLEDTDCSIDELFSALITFGYPLTEARKIVSCTQELTDVFTKDDYPLFSKKARKKLEGLRLIGISSKAQTVKYADLIDNINWMVLHDKKNLVKYLRKKYLLLTELNQGEAQLHQVVVNLVEKNLSLYKSNLL